LSRGREIWDLLTKDKENAKSRIEAVARSYYKAKERYFQISSTSLVVIEAF
jgi:hypothetical protein